MAIRIIREYGDEILKKKSKEVDVIDDKIRELINDMMETMHKYNGLGLAAPQVGILKRIIVIDLYEEGPCFALVNPVLEKAKGKQIVDEGCLSFPNQFAKVERPLEVVVTGLDENGKKTKIVAKGLLAQALCHEIDHLNGELFIEKMLPGTMEILSSENVENVEDVEEK